MAEQMGLSVKDVTNEYTRFTPAEQVTLMTLWSLFRSPLMMGGHLPENDAATLALLANEEVIAVNQRSRGSREVLAEGDRVAWAAEAEEGGSTYVGLFNRGGQEGLAVEVPLSRLGLGDTARVRDLWKRQDLGTVQGVVRASVPSHGAARNSRSTRSCL